MGDRCGVRGVCDGWVVWGGARCGVIVLRGRWRIRRVDTMRRHSESREARARGSEHTRSVERAPFPNHEGVASGSAELFMIWVFQGCASRQLFILLAA